MNLTGYVCLLWLSFSAGLPWVVGAAAGAFPIPYNSEKESPPLSPEQAVQTIQLPPRFRAALFAGEPDVQQPIAITTDAKGRLWVAENYTYAERALNYDLKLRDRILIFEDAARAQAEARGDEKAGHEGRFSSRKVFWDQGQHLTSMAVGFGGVYVLCPPRLLFIPDRNGDDIPDGEPEVLLDGFDDDAVRHTIANGLKWGPDGWLYGRHGIQATSHVGRPGTPPDQRVAVNVGIWRFHPLTKKFEMVAEGTTNPWGSDWDDNGQLFFINTVIGHLWHVVPGAYFKRMYGEPKNPHVYELIDQTADHVHWDTRERWDDIRKLGVTPTTSQAGGGHAHSGLMIYLGDNWPERYRNTLFTVNYHGKRLNNDILERSGADYVGHHGKDFMKVGDPWFRGVDLLYGADGGVYVTDWSDTGECHDNDAIHRTSGRIYKITYGDHLDSWSGDLTKLSDSELVRMQEHPNEWFVRQGRLVLQERYAAGRDMAAVHGELRNMLAKGRAPRVQLRALWALYVTGGAPESLLAAYLHDPDEQLRVWAIQLLSDQGAPPPPMVAEFGRMAAQDSSGLVLSFLTAAMRRLNLTDRWPIAEGIASRGEFATDRVLPLLLWYEIEPAVIPNPEKAEALAHHSRMPKIRRFIARRIFEELASQSRAADALIAQLGEEKPDEQLDILSGMSEALAGAQRPAPPKSWATVAPALEESSRTEVRDLSWELDALFGNPAAVGRLREIAMDRGQDPARRHAALQVLLKRKAEGLAPLLGALMDEPELAEDAVRGMAVIDDGTVATMLLNRYPSLHSPKLKSEVINTLVARRESASALLTAIRYGKIKKQDIGATQLRQLRSMQDPELNQTVRSIWPQLDDSPSGRQKQFARLKSLLTPGNLRAADLSQGREIFQHTCAVCHTLYGEGAKIGPDLTGSDRHNLDYLMDNIVDPSGIVAETYRVSILELKDGRVINGIILNRTDQALTVQTVSEKLVLPRAEIESIHESKLSMMPDGLLEAMPGNQVRDLFGYLMSSNPVPLPKQ